MNKRTIYKRIAERTGVEYIATLGDASLVTRDHCPSGRWRMRPSTEDLVDEEFHGRSL